MRAKGDGGDKSSFYSNKENLVELSTFLQGVNGPPVCVKKEHSKRVFLLKGENLMNFLLVESSQNTKAEKTSKWPNNLPKCRDKQDVLGICKQLCFEKLLLSSIKSKSCEFDESNYYSWASKNNKSFENFLMFLTISLVLGFLFLVCFPLWPNRLKQLVLYTILTLSYIAFLSFTLKGVVFAFVWIVGYFSWVFKGSHQSSISLMTFVIFIVGFILSFLCFSPSPFIFNLSFKDFIWYLFLLSSLFIFFLLILRVVIFVMMWIIGLEFWILPNLFDEKLNFFDSFMPLYSIQKTKPAHLMYRDRKSVV